jgi:ATP-dependent Lhr-like helicase
MAHRFHPAVTQWFELAFERATRPQREGWPAIARGDSTLILAPTGTGKTLTAFLSCLDRLMFQPVPDPAHRCRILYVSPLKALAVDVERNLRAPLAGIANVAQARGERFYAPAVSIRTGDTPAAERARFQREPADILITTPESLFLLLTSNARERLRFVETVIIDEIHALVSTKRGAHLALSLERLSGWWPAASTIGLSATQRPLEEVAKFLGGAIATRGARASAPPAARSLKAHAPKAGFAGAVHEEFEDDHAVTYRPVTIVDASAPKKLAITVQTLEGCMAAMGSRSSSQAGRRRQARWRSQSGVRFTQRSSI